MIKIVSYEKIVIRTNYKRPAKMPKMTILKFLQKSNEFEKLNLPDTDLTKIRRRNAAHFRSEIK